MFLVSGLKRWGVKIKKRQEKRKTTLSNPYETLERFKELSSSNNMKHKFLWYLMTLWNFLWSTDINECKKNTHNCTSRMRCENAQGSFTCNLCKMGYRLNSVGHCIPLLQVPCRLAWAIKDLQPTLQLISLIISNGFPMFIQSARLSNIFSLVFLCLFFHQIFLLLPNVLVGFFL